MRIEFNYRQYDKLLRSDLSEHQLKNPKFIPVEYEENIYILTEGKVYCSKAISVGDITIPKNIKQLARKSKYVIFSDARILGTNKHVLTEFDFQPRFKPFIWLIVEEQDNQLFWFKEHATATDLQDFIASLMLVTVDSISSPTRISGLGKSIYKELYSEVLGFNLWTSSESFFVLMDINSATKNSPFYSYNIRQLLKEVR